MGQKKIAAATAAEMIQEAGLDWTVESRKLFFDAPAGLQDIENHTGIVRADRNSLLGIVGGRYQLIQNREAFTFFDHVVGQGKAIYSGAGDFGHGRRVWIQAKLPNDIVIKRSGTEDRTEKFLLLSNSHDGTSSLRMFFTPIRIICQNTLIAALREGAGQGITIRHTGEIKDKVTEAQRALGLAVKFYDDMAQMAQAFASKTLQTRQISEYVNTVFPAKDETSTRIKNIRADVHGLIEDGKGNAAPGIRGTVWAALNGVVEYVDHNRSARGEDPQEKAENRLESAWFGYGATVKARAWSAAMELVG